MEGYGTDYGVTPRAINELFNHTENLKGEWSYTMTLSMLEIYNETIRDLLDNPTSGKKEKLDIRQTAEGNQVVGLTECQV